MEGWRGFVMSCDLDSFILDPFEYVVRLAALEPQMVST
jgi:hypothetical protein